jgi:hypothetical protein
MIIDFLDGKPVQGKSGHLPEYVLGLEDIEGESE